MKRTLQVLVTAFKTLYLAAGGLWQCVGPQQHNGGSFKLVILRYCRPDGCENLCFVQFSQESAFYLCCHCQLFALFCFNRKGGHRALVHCLMCSFNCKFNIGRVIVPAPDDDQVFHPAGNEKLALFDKAQVAGAEPGP